KAIPFILDNQKDLVALAQTGTGKTAAFGLPILNQIAPQGLQAIILCPTRELCIQISKDFKLFAKYLKNTSITPVYGGERIDIQIRALKRGTNIVVGTPGRVCDLIRRGNLKLQNIKWLVLDEADEMLDMGFKEDLDAVLEQIPDNKRTLLFSATMSKSVNSIAKKYMNEAQEISVGEKNIGAENVSHEYYVVHARDRFEALKRILDSLPGVYGILFCRTRRETQEVADKLKQAHYNTEAMHGDISQSMRTKIMDRFRKKRIHLLVATDVAARGIDVNDLSHIINYQLPDKNEIYTHRSGRTGRAKKSGVCISIINMREIGIMRRLESMLGKTFEQKKVPSGKIILNNQIDNFIKEIKESNTSELKNDKSYQEMVSKLKEVKKEDLIKHFIDAKFSRFIDSYQNARDLNSDVKIGDGRMNMKGVNLKINFGKRHGLDIRTLFELINSNRSLQGIVIGRINLMSEYTVFSVEEKFANKALKFLAKTSFRGKKIKISITNEDPGPARNPRKRSRRPRGGYKRNRNGHKGGSRGRYRGRKR
ncbi:MAG: DEAD/DEAH box helicase, partial [Patescibacteria group bacterium]|nr:DEAD/DEAH box helicase [Patescibacteria group bacterium]